MSMFIAILMIIGLWLILRERQSKPNKYPTLEDTRRKYPKRKSQEQLRREAQKELDRERFAQLESEQLIEAITKERELISLVRDSKTADRLLKGIKSKYPNQGRLWIAEKAISDVHRDRRAY